MSNIFQKFKELPETSEVSRVELAEKIGVHRNNLSKYFSSNTEPRLELFEKFCDAVGYELKLVKK